jgi:regulator of cell morphogenesis and NO signaling
MSTPYFIKTGSGTVASAYRNIKFFPKLDKFSRIPSSRIPKQPAIDARQVVLNLRTHNLPSKNHNKEFKSWNINALIDHIVNTHHQYAEENAAVIYDLAKNVAFSQSEEHPELTKLVSALFLFLNDLLNHMKEEMETLFPNIRQLVKNKNSEAGSAYSSFGFIREFVTKMKRQHYAAGNELKVFRNLTNNYQVPADASLSYQFLFEKMKEFEKALFLHMDIEGNILFPKVIKLDEGVKE